MASAGTAAASIKNSRVGSAFLDNNGSGRWGGELRYDYQQGDLSLTQAAVAAAFRSESHSIHYDILWHLTQPESRVRPFLAAGGGIKVFQGTGTEVAFQPLSKIALLTKAQDLAPLISVGAGVKFRIGSHIQLRAEVHDYLTPFPKQVIVPTQNAKTSGWLQEIVPTFGLAFLF